MTFSRERPEGAAARPDKGAAPGGRPESLINATKPTRLAICRREFTINLRSGRRRDRGCPVGGDAKPIRARRRCRSATAAPGLGSDETGGLVFLAAGDAGLPGGVVEVRLVDPPHLVQLAPLEERDQRLVVRRGDPERRGFAQQRAIQRVDLGAAPGLDVLEHRGLVELLAALRLDLG